MHERRASIYLAIIEHINFVMSYAWANYMQAYFDITWRKCSLIVCLNLCACTALLDLDIHASCQFQARETKGEAINNIVDTMLSIRG